MRGLYYILIGLMITAVSGNYPCTGNDPIQYSALMTLYNATDGPNWVYTAEGKKWNTDSNYCSWSGVNCEINLGSGICNNVADLSLSGVGMRGQIPLELANLTHLRFLFLNKNPALNGPIASAVIKHLSGLWISQTGIEGSLDFRSMNCQLQYLNVDATRVDSIYIDNCTQLYQIDLSYAPISVLSYSGNYSNLGDISAAMTKLGSSVWEFVCQPQVYSLDLSYNPVPIDCLSRLRDIIQLHLRKVGYNLDFAKLGYNWPQLNYLDLRDNQLHGYATGVHFPQLSTILLSNNRLQGAVPSYMSPLLTNLYLDGNDFQTIDIPNFQVLYIDLRNNPNLVYRDTYTWMEIDHTTYIRTESRFCPTLTHKDITRPLTIAVSPTFYDIKLCYPIL